MITFRAGGAIAGQTFTMTDADLKYQSATGHSFTVRRSDIETVTVDSGRAGRGWLKVIGRGTELAKVELPLPWAEKSRTWILDHYQGPIPEGGEPEKSNKYTWVAAALLGALVVSCIAFGR